MALIFRSILEVEVDDFVASAPALFARWLQRKFRDDALEVAGGGETKEIAPNCEAAEVTAYEGDAAAYRAWLYEKREAEEVKTTFTALTDGSASWAWVDLERWADDAWRSSWVPYLPWDRGPCSRLRSLQSRFHRPRPRSPRARRRPRRATC